MNFLRRAFALVREHELPILVFLIVGGASFFFTERDNFQSGTYAERFFETKAMADLGTFELDAFKRYLGYDQAIYNGHNYSSHSTGQSVVMLPSYYLFGKPWDALRGHKYKDERTRLQRQGWVVQATSLPPWTALAFVAMFLVLRSLLGVNQAYAFPLTILGYFGSLAFPYSTIGMISSLSGPLLTIAMAYFYFWLKTGRLALMTISACCFAVIIAVKESDIFVPFVVGLFLCFHRRDARAASILFVACSTSLALILFRNWMLFDGPFNFSIKYFLPRGEPGPAFNFKVFTADAITWPRVYRLMLSTRDGWLFYSPLILFTIPGLIALWRRSRDFAVVLGGGLLVMVVFWLGYHHWGTDANFGFRHQLHLYPLLYIPALYAIGSEWQRIYPKFLVVLIAAWSLVICLVGGLTSPWADYKIADGNAFANYTLPLLQLRGSSNVLTLGGSGYSVGPEDTSFFFNAATTSMFVLVILLAIYRGCRVAGLFRRGGSSFA